MSAQSVSICIQRKDVCWPVYTTLGMTAPGRCLQCQTALGRGTRKTCHAHSPLPCVLSSCGKSSTGSIHSTHQKQLCGFGGALSRREWVCGVLLGLHSWSLSTEFCFSQRSALKNSLLGRWRMCNHIVVLLTNQRACYGSSGHELPWGRQEGKCTYHLALGKASLNCHSSTTVTAIHTTWRTGLEYLPKA